MRLRKLQTNLTYKRGFELFDSLSHFHHKTLFLIENVRGQPEEALNFDVKREHLFYSYVMHSNLKNVVHSYCVVLNCWNLISPQSSLILWFFFPPLWLLSQLASNATFWVFTSSFLSWIFCHNHGHCWSVCNCNCFGPAISPPWSWWRKDAKMGESCDFYICLQSVWYLFYNHYIYILTKLF